MGIIQTLEGLRRIIFWEKTEILLLLLFSFSLSVWQIDLKWWFSLALGILKLSYLCWNLHHQLLDSRAFELNPWPSLVSSLQRRCRTSQTLYHVSQHFTINFFLETHTHTHILLIVCLWRAMTNTDLYLISFKCLSGNRNFFYSICLNVRAKVTPIVKFYI